MIGCHHFVPFLLRNVWNDFIFYGVNEVSLLVHPTTRHLQALASITPLSQIIRQFFAEDLPSSKYVFSIWIIVRSKFSWKWQAVKKSEENGKFIWMWRNGYDVIEFRLYNGIFMFALFSPSSTFCEKIGILSETTQFSYRIPSACTSVNAKKIRIKSLDLRVR